MFLKMKTSFSCQGMLKKGNSPKLFQYFHPEEPLNGLDVCYYSKSVLTGAGTFAREAAFGYLAVSFSRRKTLTVDKI